MELRFTLTKVCLDKVQVSLAKFKVFFIVTNYFNDGRQKRVSNGVLRKNLYFFLFVLSALSVPLCFAAMGEQLGVMKAE
jgi:hypothetical protein